MKKLILYTKPDCSLCDEALEVIERVRDDVPFELREIDIESDSTLFERYRDLIPVLTIDGEQAFELRISEQALRGRLAKPAGHQTTNGTVGVA